MGYEEDVVQVYLSLGSNLGDREGELKSALTILTEKYSFIDQSGVYQTAPWGFVSKDNFLNMCVGFRTIQSADSVLRSCQDIEMQLGRSRSKKGEGYSSRNIDLDILYYGDSQIMTNDLIVPHPRIYERNFVLLPLLDIASDFIDPKRGKSILELKEDCVDDSPIHLYKKKLLRFL